MSSNTEENTSGTSTESSIEFDTQNISTDSATLKAGENTSGSSTESNLEFDNSLYINYQCKKSATQNLDTQNISTDSGSSKAADGLDLNICQKNIRHSRYAINCGHSREF